MKILNSESLKPAIANDTRHDRFLTECQMFQQAWDNYGGVASPCCDRCTTGHYAS